MKRQRGCYNDIVSTTNTAIFREYDSGNSNSSLCGGVDEKRRESNNTANLASNKRRSRCVLLWSLLLLAFLPLSCMAQAAQQESHNNNDAPSATPTTQQPQPQPQSELSLDFDSFSKCNLTSQEMVTLLTPNDAVDPCIIFDIKPDLFHVIPYRTFLVTMVQVTPATDCRDARDGATTSIDLLNEQNGGKGLAVGFHQDFHIQFRFVSIIAGNPGQLGGDLYGVQHAAVLRAALKALQPQYIVGTCSFAAAFEKQPALDYHTMVLAQVGPPGYYQNDPPNPYIFGVHINSDEYPIPTVRALGFRAAAQPPPQNQNQLNPENNEPQEQERTNNANVRIGTDNANASTTTTTTTPTTHNNNNNNNNALTRQAVRVIYRTSSEFFNSTCNSAVSALREFGFTNLVEVAYDPEGDDNNNGIANQFDEEWLRQRADEICPPSSDDNPAIFACVLTEQDILLQRWKENACRPISLWMTPATWGWAKDNPTVVPYMQGGGQWHEAFTYNDRFFDSGRAMLDYNEQKFGYFGSYDTVVAYAIPMIYAEHLETFYRVVDDPDPEIDFATEEGYERLRRAMVVLNTETIFGPLSYNDNQRNVGRGAAGTQWQQDATNASAVRNVLVSPFLQAEADAIIPAPSAVDCSKGTYVNETLVETGDAILGNKCALCPADSFTPGPNQQRQCYPCPVGSSTGGGVGEAYCVTENDNLLSTGTLAFGYTAASVTLLLSLVFIGWLIRYRNDPVVRISQIEFLLLVCLGAIISSSTIIALSMQAGSNEDTEAASMACQSAPFLYTIGWVLQYGSLTAKSFRLNKILNNPQMLRVKVTFLETSSIIAVILALDLIVVLTWTILYPLEYTRTVDTVEMNDTSNVMIISSHGSCAIVDGPSIWAFAGPICAVHAVLMITTNIILYKVRNVGDRYQEQKYVALASVFVCEVLVIGLPVVISVGDDPVAVFIALSGIIALNDIGMLCFVFVPKIMFQKKGFDEGINIGETILKSTHKKAYTREGGVQSFRNMSSNSQCSARSMHPSLGSANTTGRMALSSRDESRVSTLDNIAEERSEDGPEQTLEQEEAFYQLTPRTTTDCDEDLSNSNSERSSLLQAKFEQVVSKNYDLELEIGILRQREKHLKKKIQELEEQAGANGRMLL